MNNKAAVNQKRNHQLLGFFIFVLFILIIFPFVFVDKSTEYSGSLQNITTSSKVVIKNKQTKSKNDVKIVERSTSTLQKKAAPKTQSEPELKLPPEAPATVSNKVVVTEQPSVKEQPINTVSKESATQVNKKANVEKASSPTSTPDALKDIIKNTETGNKGSVADSKKENINQTNKTVKVVAKKGYYIRLAWLTNQLYLNEKIELLKQNKYTIYTEQNGKGTILMIGPYANIKNAEQDKKKVRSLGFTDSGIKIIEINPH